MESPKQIVKPQNQDDLPKRDFSNDKPLEKAVTDISELKAKEDKRYVSAIFDCFDLMPLGLSIEDNMKAVLCCHTPDNAKKRIPTLRAALYIQIEEVSI